MQEAKLFQDGPRTVLCILGDEPSEASRNLALLVCEVFRGYVAQDLVAQLSKVEVGGKNHEAVGDGLGEMFVKLEVGHECGLGMNDLVVVFYSEANDFEDVVPNVRHFHVCF